MAKTNQKPSPASGYTFEQIYQTPGLAKELAEKVHQANEQKNQGKKSPSGK